MTSDEIRAAIERLETMEPGDYVGVGDVANVVWKFAGDMVPAVELRYTLINLLRQADPKTHIELPKGADGEAIHVGDEVESDYHEDGKVVGVQYYESVRALIAVRPNNWSTASWHDPSEYRHYHRPTVEDVLCEMLEKAVGFSDAHTTVAINVIAEYADKLREVIANDDAE